MEFNNLVNSLAKEISPYLLQHSENPVEWYPWGKEAMKLAQAEDKPILLSIGYAACHWCHVMAHESFEDHQTAEIMNKYFINIKVDREERPDIDSIYMTSLALFGEQGGWPLTMFCTPEGKPFWGGTYFPPKSKFGRPGFPELLEHISKIYRIEREKVETNSVAIVSALDEMSKPKAAKFIMPDALISSAELILKEFDSQNGGFGTAPKFPQAPVLSLIWRAYKKSNSTELLKAVVITLDKIAQGGIYDHLGGGFARYSTDPIWLVPHFEKMLYDNAQLIELYTDALQEKQNPLYSQIINETVNWVLREMLVKHGSYTGFCSTIDADSEGTEGKYYIWSIEEIRKLLGEDANLFIENYDVQEDGNWEGANILNRTRHPRLKDAETESKLKENREHLFVERQKRIPPGLDDKVLADWNGLMISALTKAAIALDRPDWLNVSKSAFNFITHNMSENVEGFNRLQHSWRAGQARHLSTLDDYANMCRAGLLLLEATQSQKFLDIVESWIRTLNYYYWDKEGGGYYYTASDASDIISRTKNSLDNATPSGNGIMVEVLARLYFHTGKEDYRSLSENIISIFSGDISNNPFSYVTLINGAQFLSEAIQIVIIRGKEKHDEIKFLECINNLNIPTKILSMIDSIEQINSSHPASGKKPIDGKTTVYVCFGRTCSAPITDPNDLRSLLLNSRFKASNHEKLIK
tara:strand:- start:35608 stop:37695 length:2088 start_codon:yes stop_codon:yes gene_type:complete